MRALRSMRPLAGVLLLAGCSTVQYQSSKSEPVAVRPPQPLGEAVHWMRNSAEYQAVVRQTYTVAGQRLREISAGRQPGTWAVAADADETVISNSEYEKELNLAGQQSTLERWDAWVARRAAPPLPGAVEFLALVHELGGRIAIVTNRIDDHCPDTQANFRAFDIPFDVMLCRTESREKEGRWEKVENGTASSDLPPLEIVMWLGDNIGDFPGLDQETRFGGARAFRDFGVRYFAMPNPLYGSWEDNPRK